MKIIILLFFFINLYSYASGQAQEEKEFNKLLGSNWTEVFYDSCSLNWQDKWTLDGTRASVSNSTEGMNFYAGNEHGNDTCHAVLWTKDSFQGDIKIEYDFTKLDTQIVSVIILYIQATGESPYSKNIHEWDSVRVIPAMRNYYNNMNTLHISYSAFDNNNKDSSMDYIRARRYMPSLKKGLPGTEIGKSYDNSGLFMQNVKHHITVIKKGYDLFMKIQNNEKEVLCHWNYSKLPLINEGCVGLRHMYTRGARYSNFKISILE